MKDIDPKLIEAYRESIITVYLEDGEYRFSTKFKDSILPMELEPCAWVVTACNPRSVRQKDEENILLQDKLAAVLDGVPGAEVFPALGSSESGDWSEPSFVVVGIAPEELAMIARLFEQNAVYRIDGDGCEVVFV